MTSIRLAKVYTFCNRPISFARGWPVIGLIQKTSVPICADWVFRRSRHYFFFVSGTMFSYSAITCAPSNSSVAPISKLSSTTMAVVSDP